MTIFNFISLFGGLALFLYGMRLMGDGLKQGSSAALKKAMDDIPTYSTYCEDTYIDALRAAGKALGAADANLFGDIAKKVDECANALKSYQSSYPAASGSTAK